MVSCDICGKEFKNTQGLRGHKNFVHSDKVVSGGQSVPQQQLGSKVEQLETRLEQVASNVQQATELAEMVLSSVRKVPYHTHRHEHSHSKYSYNNEHRELLEQVDERLRNLRSELTSKLDLIEQRLHRLEPTHCSLSSEPRMICRR